MAHSKGVMGKSSMEGPFTKVEQIQRKATRDGEASGPTTAGSHCLPKCEDRGVEKDTGTTESTAEGGVLSFGGEGMHQQQIWRLNTSSSLFPNSLISSWFLPLAQTNRKLEVMGAVWVQSLRSASWGTEQSRKGQRVDLEERWRISSAEPVLRDLGRLF